MQNWMPFFVAVTAVAVVLQALILLALYLDLRRTLGVPELGFRVGRDRVSLGPVGLLLDEADLDDGRRIHINSAARSSLLHRPGCVGALIDAPADGGGR